MRKEIRNKKAGSSQMPPKTPAGRALEHITTLAGSHQVLRASRNVLEKELREQDSLLARANRAVHTEIAARQKAEREARLLLNITRAISEAHDFPLAVGLALQMTCDASEWDYAEAWIPRADGVALECVPAWCQCGKGLEAFRRLSEGFTFAPGVGLPGRVWTSKRPEWVENMSIEPLEMCPRAEVALEAGLKAALGIPILVGEEVLAVLVFFTSESRKQNQQLVELALSSAPQLGSLLQRIRAEEELLKVRNELEIRIQERTSELAKVNEALEADITERKRAEAALRESEERWRLMSDSLPVLISYIDSEERYQLNNAAYEKWFGISKEAFKGRKVREIIGEEAYLQIKPHIEAALAGQPRAFDGDLKYSLGTRYVHIDYVPRHSDDGQIPGFYALVQDITERKQVEEEVRRRENWLQSLIETTQDAVVSIDREGRIVLFNPAAERIFGYSKAEIQGQKANLLMAEPYAAEHEKYIERYERTGEAKAIGRIRTVAARRKNGEVFPIELSVTEVGKAESEEVHYAVFIRDISEKERLQDQLIENERLAAIGTTMSVFAHEIGNPINAMFVTTQLLERHISRRENKPDEAAISAVKGLKGELTRLSHLLHDFRTLSRRERYRFRPVSLTALIGEIYSMEARTLGAQGIRVEQSFPQELPPVRADHEKLHQAVLNLCKNATEAMPEGGTLSCTAYRSGDQVVLEMRDTGIGIADGVDIFEPFITTKSTGTGLGLMIVRQIVSAHGGTISYSSAQGKGTTFTISLPVYQPATDADGKPL